MFNESFFPTPRAIADKMLAALPDGIFNSARVLEPSAGKGDLVDALISKTRMNKARIHCCELHPDLQATIRGKGYTLVGTDFLSFTPDERYNLILMNPPFADGDKHLLHAWDILDSGDILCLLNEQTILNAHSARRKQVVELARQWGEIESLGSCFVGSERSTEVRVCLVHLRKEKPQSSAYDFLKDGFEHEASASFSTGRPATELATKEEAKNLVCAYGRARDIFLDIALKVQELGYYAKMLGEPSDISTAVSETLGPLVAQGVTLDAQEAAYSEFVRRMKKVAWNRVFKLSGFSSYLSEGVRREFDKMREEQGGMAFNMANIATMLDMLFASRSGILQQCVLDAFDLLTKYHDENRLELEGWKTNDAWRVNHKFILPYLVEFPSYARTFDLSYNRRRELEDLDRAMASLEGRRLEDITQRIVDSLQKAFREGAGSGDIVTSTYFEMRAFKKGTIHFRFLDKDLWERFNLVAAQGKNWLPDDWKGRAKEARVRNRFADKFGLVESVSA